MSRTNIDIPLLLLNMPFQPGDCLEQMDRMENKAVKDLAMMQYYYFTCHHEQAAEMAADYLEYSDLKTRICALLVFSFANMAMENKKETRRGIAALKKLSDSQNHFPSESGIPLMLSAVRTLLHLPVSEKERQSIDEQSRNCYEGGRLLCCYLLEQKSWNQKEYERAIGAVETALHMTKDSYPLITLYFYLSASEASMYLKDIRRAETYFQKAWKLAKADGFWGPLAEMHGHLQIFLEKAVKREHPAIYKQILLTTHQYRNGYRTIICEGLQPKEECLKKSFQENLTGMEYAVAFLAGLGWSNQEIGDYFYISVRTVKYYMAAVFNKLNISSRREISALLLD